MSTRLGSLMPLNDTDGRVMALAEPPEVVSCPVRVIDDSHSVGAVPSPVAGIVWASA
jgi:hypothetical protein